MNFLEMPPALNGRTANQAQVASFYAKCPPDIAQALGLAPYKAWTISPGNPGREYRTVEPTWKAQP